MQYLKVSLVAYQVWSKVKLLHTLFDGYLNHVRQAIYALQNIKHVVYYNAMQGTTQTRFLVKLLKSRTLSSFLNRQNVASSSGLVKISANWSSVLTPSSEISFFVTWSLRKWWWISMCLVRECWTGLFASFTALSLSQQSLFHIKNLCTTSTRGNVFRFDGGQSHTILFLRGPRHKWSTKQMAPSGCAFLSTLQPA